MNLPALVGSAWTLIVTSAGVLSVLDDEEDPPLLSAGPQESACWLCEGGAREAQGVREYR